MGDLNLPEFEWNSRKHPDNVLYNSADDFVCYNGLSQLVNEPTRGDNILDIVITSEVLSCGNIHIHPPISNSDHCNVKFELHVSLPNCTDAPLALPLRPDFGKADWVGLNKFFSQFDWNSAFRQCENIETFSNLFYTVVATGMQYYVPSNPVSQYLSKPRYPKHIRKLLSAKLRSWKLCRKFRTSALYSKFKVAASKYQEAIKRHNIELENKLIDSNNVGSFYR